MMVILRVFQVPANKLVDRMKFHKRFFLAVIVLITILASGCGFKAKATPTPEATPIPSVTSVPTATNIVIPTATETALPTATATIIPTPTETLIPFAGFRDMFRLFRTWYLEGKTYFYFLNAGIEDKLFATAEEYPLDCHADPSFPVQMICVYDGILEGYSMMKFRFFTDSARTVQVFEADYDADLLDNTIYHPQFDCPDRGKNVTCVSEYRLYDGICYYSHTCYDACGLYYSKDNLPEVYNEFQGFTTPCN